MSELKLSELAALCGATLHGDPERTVRGPASLSEARPDEISFLANSRYRSQLDTTRAAAVVVAFDVECDRADLTFLRCKDPNRAFTAVVKAFANEDVRPPAGVHASALVDPSATVDPTAVVGPLCVVGPRATIGARAWLRASVVVGEGASIGADTLVHPQVVVYARTVIGERCTLHAGAVIGSDGYGFEPTREGWEKIPQCGIAIVEDDVEIGANATIDRARFGATRIGRGAKLDNLVHVAHNVVVGEAALLIAQTGIAGSSRIGKRAILAGQVGVTGHASIGDGARIAAQSGVFGDVPAGADYMGYPARPRGESLRLLALVARLPELTERVRELEKKLAGLEGKDR